MISSPGPERDSDHAKLLMQEYSFDLAGFEANELVAIWHDRLQTEPSWIRAAVLEALYLGRYKAFSVEQILQGWKRRGHPVRHFNSDFERVVFGPIDPVVSQYAAMTSVRPSEPMSPQVDQPQNGAAVGNKDGAPLPSPEIAQGASLSGEIVPGAETNGLPSTTESDPQPATEPQQQELFASVIDHSTSTHANLPAAADAAAPDSPESLFSQPEPIQKFTPAPEPSEFYQRLQAVARHDESS